MLNYEFLKDLAKQQKVKVTDLIALAPHNDPFYVGKPNDLDLGRWFANLWRRFGYNRGVHLRRVHYQIISQNPPIKLPDGTTYENTERCWDILGMASKMARYLELVDPAAFVDRRNHDPLIFVSEDPDFEPSIDIDARRWDNEIRLPGFPELPDFYIADYQSPQTYHLEIWCEKTTMDDVLVPICRQYQANLIRGVGELSITATLELANRIADAGKPARIFYISDFDPAGKSMPVAVARKAEYFIRKAGGAADVRLFPIVLTEQQVRQFRLPRTPIKETERRRDSFEQRFGSGATELDALEALFPGRLRQIVQTALNPYYDFGLARRTEEAEEVLRRDLDQKRQAILDGHASEVAALEAEYQQISAALQARLADHLRRRAALWETITDELREEKPDITDYPLPRPEEADELGEGLYNSQREYFEQIQAYKDFQGKAS